MIQIPNNANLDAEILEDIIQVIGNFQNHLPPVKNLFGGPTSPAVDINYITQLAFGGAKPENVIFYDIIPNGEIGYYIEAGSATYIQAGTIISCFNVLKQGYDSIPSNLAYTVSQIEMPLFIKPKKAAKSIWLKEEAHQPATKENIDNLRLILNQMINN